MITNEDLFRAAVEANKAIGYGRMMEIISRMWQKEDPKGAFAVGDCYGIYEIKKERCRKEGHDTRHGTNWDWCDRCGACIHPDTGKEIK